MPFFEKKKKIINAQIFKKYKILKNLRFLVNTFLFIEVSLILCLMRNFSNIYFLNLNFF